MGFESGPNAAGEFIEHHLAHVVPIALVLRAGVAEANDQPGVSHGFNPRGMAWTGWQRPEGRPPADMAVAGPLGGPGTAGTAVVTLLRLLLLRELPLLRPRRQLRFQFPRRFRRPR